jgi:hypothetical protein
VTRSERPIYSPPDLDDACLRRRQSANCARSAAATASNSAKAGLRSSTISRAMTSGGDQPLDAIATAPLETSGDYFWMYTVAPVVAVQTTGSPSAQESL